MSGSDGRRSMACRECCSNASSRWYAGAWWNFKIGSVETAANASEGLDGQGPWKCAAVRCGADASGGDVRQSGKNVKSGSLSSAALVAMWSERLGGRYVGLY